MFSVAQENGSISYYNCKIAFIRYTFWYYNKIINSMYKMYN